MKKLFSIPYKSFLVITLALNHMSVIAQNQKDTIDVYSISLEELMNIKVTTATKSSGKVDAVPSIVEVITREQIKQRGYQTLAQVLNDIPDNHEDRSNWGIGEPLNQNVGFGFRFDTGQNTLLLFNGQRLNAFLPGNRFGGEEYLLDNIERIEIIRGPGSALYGANAFTSVVNIISRTAEAGESTVSTEVNYVPTSKGFASSSSFLTGTANGGTIGGAFRYFTEKGQDLSVQNSLYGNATLRDGVNHAIDGDLFYKQGGFRLYSKITNQSRPTFTGFNSVNPTNMKDLTLSMYAYSVGTDYTFKPGGKTEVKLSAGWHQDNWTEVALLPAFQVTPDGTALVRDPAGNPMLDNVPIYRDGQTINTSFFIDGQGANTQSVDGEAQFTYNYSKDNNLILGYYHSDDRVLDAYRPTELNLNPFGYVPFRVIRDNTNNWLFDTNVSRINDGLYGQVNHALAKGLLVTMGARLDMYSGTGLLKAQQYTAFNPRGGIVYSSKSSTFKLLYGLATRIPNGFETLSSVAILGSPTNTPERIGMLQLLWINNWSSNLRTEFGGFRCQITNRLETDANISEQMLAQGFVGQFINVGNGTTAVNNGIDGKLIYKLKGINAMLNFTQYFGSDDGTGARLAYIPNTMINANVNIPYGIFQFDLGINYRGQFTKAASDPRPPVNAYLLGRLNILVSPQRCPLQFKLTGRNIFDTKYNYPSSSVTYTNNFPARGMEVLLSVIYKMKN
ncbi:hypothetical protein WSM22_06200 [Cytophagales bacterium WSM2-2]|nr:hypothetical protein WSM22_06200 [Cytophagales bacterium WSM2-2]